MGSWKPGHTVSSKWTAGQREVQQAECLRLWLEGTTQRDIATQLDMPRSTVQKRIRDAMEAMKPHALVDEYRARQMAELLKARTELMRRLHLERDDTLAVVRLTDSILRLHEREARLLNLDKAPRPLDEISGMTDAQLMDFLDRAVADNPDVGAE